MLPRWISYRQAEQLCAVLARELQAQLGDDLATCTFVAIPRGGLLVLGMLSYLLGLDRERLLPGRPAAEPVVVVDDCSLSGARFAAMLQRLDAEQIVFAHLVSPLGLRAAILEQEPRVRACVAAEVLPELPCAPDEPAPHGSQRRFWSGRTQPVAFAWSEPDQVIWNPHTGQEEASWHRVSPGCCLDARADLGLPPEAQGEGVFDVPAGVLWRVDGDEDVWLWHAGEDQLYGLHGVSGAMWRALVGYGETGGAAHHLCARYQVAPERLQADLERFALELSGRGLLGRRPAPDGDGD